MTVSREFLRSYNLVNILYIHLILGGVTIKNNTRKHTATFKRKYLTTSNKLLTGMRIFINFSLVAILIRLSGNVETNPGSFNFEVKNVCFQKLTDFVYLLVKSV